MLTVFIGLFAYGVTSFDYYGGSTGPTSKQFSATLQNGGKTYTPHVYGINCPEQDKSGHINNWIEFEQDSNEETTITVEKLDGSWPSDTHIRPISYNIDLTFEDGKSKVTFTVKGNAKHISVHYGTDTENEDTNSAIYNSMLVFITPPNISQMYKENILNQSDANTITFETGKEYKLTDGGYSAGTGVLSVNDSVNKDINTIIMERGAYVYGKIDVNLDNVNVYGPGVLDGSYFDYDQRKTGPV